MYKINSDEYQNKSNNLNSLKQYLQDLNLQIEEISQENLELKDKIKILSNKSTIYEKEYSQKREIELQAKNKDLVILKEKEIKYENLYAELQQIIKKKYKIVLVNNEVNLKLMELCKIKKAQLKLYEALVDNKNKTQEQRYSTLNEKEEDLLQK